MLPRRQIRGRFPQVCPVFRGGRSTNLAPLRSAASQEDLVGGLFSRFLIVAPDITFLLPQPQPGDEDLRRRLVDCLAGWKAAKQQTISVPVDVQHLIEEYGYRISPFTKGQQINLIEAADEASAPYIRYGTHALKLAILLAASEVSPGDTVSLTAGHAERGIEIAERFRGYAKRVFGVLEDAEDTAVLKRIEQKLKAAPGKKMGASELHQKIGGKTKAADFHRLLMILREWGSIDMLLGTGGRGNTVLWNGH